MNGFLVIFLAALGTFISVPGRRSFSVFGLLSIFQFVIVILLVGFSMMIKRQLSFLDHKDLGYSAKNIFVARIPGQDPRGSLLVEEMEETGRGDQCFHRPPPSGGCLSEHEFCSWRK